MESRKKLEEAHYFLDKLRAVAQNSDEFMYMLSAFLNAWRSVLDVMLYDYAEKYSLGLTREDRITDHEFGIAAKVLNCTGALHFLRWWRQQRSSFQRNPLWRKRILVVHRGYPPITQTLQLYVAESLALSSTFTVSGATPPIHIESEASSAGAIQTEMHRPNRHAETYFKDLPDRSVVDYCQQAFDKMKEIVETAEREFYEH